MKAVDSPLLALMDEAYQRKSWHGTNLRGAIRGLGASAAAWRPAGARHCIAEIVVHCAYWKYAVRRRLRGEKRGSFALAGSNWLTLPEPLSEGQWREYVRLLESEHQALRAAVGELRAAQLAEVPLRKPSEIRAAGCPQTPAGGKVSIAALVRGIILHDIYHAGQIQVIKGMRKRADGRG